MTQDELKLSVAKAAIDYIRPYLESDMIVGVGTGSTANLFIDELAKEKDLFRGAISSSETSAKRLEDHGIEIFDSESSGNHRVLY